MCNDYPDATKLANLAKDAKLKEKDEIKAAQLLSDSFSLIKSFDDGMFVQSVVKYWFPKRLPEYAELMYPFAESVEELLYSVDFFRRYDESLCPPILQRAEAQSQSIDDYLQLCGMVDLFDHGWASRIFAKAANLAETFDDYIKLITKDGYFYGWPEFLDQKKVAKFAKKTLTLANSAEEYRKLSKFFAYYADKLDPSQREKRLQEIIQGR